ncbi:methylosome protein WDR77-like isoform X2 [Oscarella lobularis]|uniref:methylosome protein WDR77-like isoform X2 n=1 Tax=Oscarella lobularis TaxID=121494 RepID=UPI003313C0C1
MASFSMDQHFEALGHDQDGRIALAASSLTGTLWGGSVWTFESDSRTFDAQHASAWAPTESGNTDLTWLETNASDKRLVTTGDAGTVDLWREVETLKRIEFERTLVEHDDVAQSVSVSADKLRVASGSWDASVRVWDLGKECGRSYLAHAEAVYSVSFSPVNPDILVSASQDGIARMWDLRQEVKPARKLFCSELRGVGVRSIAWKMDGSEVLALGDETGQVVLMDMKNDGASRKWPIHADAVNRLAFSKQSFNLLASVSNDSLAIVTDTLKNETVYKSSDHTDLVRGLAWLSSDDCFRTCGLDSKLLLHSIFRSESAATSLTAVKGKESMDCTDSSRDDSKENFMEANED